MSEFLPIFGFVSISKVKGSVVLGQEGRREE